MKTYKDSAKFRKLSPVRRTPREKYVAAAGPGAAGRAAFRRHAWGDRRAAGRRGAPASAALRELWLPDRGQRRLRRPAAAGGAAARRPPSVRRISLPPRSPLVTAIC